MTGFVERVQMGQATGGQIVAATLAELGVDTIFTVSGNQILPIFDAAPDAGLRLIHMRHETAAVYAAIGAAEMTGKPGVALVSAGPGFLAGLQGVGVARSMELPILFISGAAPTGQRGNGAFQDLDQSTMAGVVCKVSLEPMTVDDLASTLSRAWNTTLSSVPGPVHVALPADVLTGTEDVAATLESPEPAQSMLDERVLDRLREFADRLSQARRPALIVRPSVARNQGFWTLAGRLGIAAIVTESPRGLSDPRYSDMIARLCESDCLLVIAPADFAVGFLGEQVVGPGSDVLLIDAPGDPAPRQSNLLHVRIDPGDALSYLNHHLQSAGVVDPDWSSAWRIAGPPPLPETPDVDGLHPLQVSAEIREALQPDDVVVLDGGEFCQWIRLGLRDVPNRVLWNGKLGAIGGSIPMALGVAATMPEGRVIAVLGDGAAGYHLSEFETAARYGLSVTSIVGNDARWGAEWHMQASRYGSGRTFATDLTFARYDMAAQGFGGVGRSVADPGELRAALGEVLASEVAACLNVRVQSVQSPALVTH